MSSDQGDLDVRTEQAWATLAAGLAEAMAALEPGRFLCLEVDGWQSDEPLDGAVPYVQVMRLEEGVHVEATSNRYLASRFRLDKEGRRRLRSLGLHKPGAEGLQNYWAAFGLDALDSAAEVLVRALREGFAVIHPAFLATDHSHLAALLREDVTDVVDRSVPPERQNLLIPAPGEAIATYADDGEHLQRLVIDALTPMLGVVPEPDADGDIAVRAGTAVVFVCVAPTMPLVTLHADVVVDVADEQAAVIEAGLLNRDTSGVQFSVDQGVVRAQMILPAVPFVPTLLRATLERMLYVLPRVDQDLARRVGGRVFLDDSGPGFEAGDPHGGPGSRVGPGLGDSHARSDAGGAQDLAEHDGREHQDPAECQDDVEHQIDERIIEVLSRMHPVLGQLMSSDAADPGSVRPRVVARCCGHDPQVMRKVLRSIRRTESALRSLRREAVAAGSSDAVGFTRHMLRRSRRIRAAVEEALRRSERKGGAPSGHGIAGEPSPGSRPELGVPSAGRPR